MVVGCGERLSWYRRRESEKEQQRLIEVIWVCKRRQAKESHKRSIKRQQADRWSLPDSDSYLDGS
jgi:hypothetical protein